MTNHTQTEYTERSPKRNERVEILLATYNSAQYLRPLMDSLLAQTMQDFHLVISDDCSRDATVELLQPYLTVFQHPVTLTVRETPSGSAAANFAGLMQSSDADFVFLCDADDVWHPEKLEKFLTVARLKEATFGKDMPLFLYSDTRVIDGAGAVTHQSYWKFKNTDATRCVTLERLLMYGPMLGCATLLNRSLVRLSSNVPLGRVAGHDWWIALVAASLGHVDILSNQTIDYRIHGQNNSHPKEVSFKALSKLSKPFYEVRRRLTARQQQAEPLLEQFGEQLTADSRKTIEGFISIRRAGFIGRRVKIFSQGYTYPDATRNMALFLFC